MCLSAFDCSKNKRERKERLTTNGAALEADLAGVSIEDSEVGVVVESLEGAQKTFTFDRVGIPCKSIVRPNVIFIVTNAQVDAGGILSGVGGRECR